MSYFRQFARTLTAIAFCLLAALTFGCGDGGSGDDDDDGPSYGEDIEGMYIVYPKITENSCGEEMASDEDTWVLTIEQNGDFSRGFVSYVIEGTSDDEVELFAGPVYGTTVLYDGMDQISVGADCIKVTAKNYVVDVNTEDDVVYGYLNTDILYYGNCDASVRNCHMETVLNSEEGLL